MFTSVKLPFYGGAIAALLLTCWPMTRGGVLFGASGQQPQNSQPGLSLRLQTSQPTIQSGSPVKVKFAATNVSDQMVQYSCWIRIPCGLVVHDGSGNEPPDTILHRRFRVDKSPNVAAEEIPIWTQTAMGVLKPAETQAHDIDVSEWFDFSRPGTYTMQVVRATEMGEIWLKSNAITVTVVPATGSETTVTGGISASKPPFSVAITMDSKAGFPVGLTVRTRNISDHIITLRTKEASKEQTGSIYKLDVRDSAGMSPPETDFGRAMKNRDLSPLPSLSATAPRGGGRFLSLKPGEIWADIVMLRTVYELSNAGQHTIQVRRWDDETKTWVESNVVTVMVDQDGRVQLPSQ